MSRRMLPVVILGGASSLACARFGGEGEPAPAPDAPTPTAPATPEEAPDQAWPLVTMATVPGGRSVPLPAGQKLLDLDLDPRGRFALVVTGDGVTTQVWRWAFDGTLAPIQSAGVQEVAFSPFDDTIYTLVQKMPEWVVERGTLSDTGVWSGGGTTYTSAARLSALVTSLTRWNGQERVFFAREHTAGRTQILSVFRTGERAYEVTSPTGNLGELTPKDIRQPPDGYYVPPNVLEAASARPLSVHPATGALLWRDGQGQVHTRPWDVQAGNWTADTVTSTSLAEVWAWSPNGWFSVVWDPAKPGVQLRHPDGTAEDVAGPVFLQPPVMAENGRTLAGLTASGLTTVAITNPLAPVRYLGAARIPDGVRGVLAEDGLALADSQATQLYQPYDDLLYGRDGAVFVSLDGMLEVLHAGFQAVFVRIERDVSRPRLDAFLTALADRAGREDERRVREIATSARRMLDGDYDFPEGQLVLAERTAPSQLHQREIQFGDFHPRGPYATSEALQNYFRAFKYIDSLRLSDEERRYLVGHEPLVQAWRAWIDAQAPYLSGTRYDGLFGEWAKSPHVLPDCLPTAVRENPVRVFPLSWGRDSEILERVTAHDDLGELCTVPQRVVPSGLDLLTAFGSPEAAAIQRAEYGRHPSLEATHAALRQRFSSPIAGEGFPDRWFRLVQILGNETAAPEGVKPEVWRRRLLETALASWASFRHTTVLVNEGTASQMGDGGDSVFEYLTTEPIRGAVDPVPAAWAQLGALLGALRDAAKGSPTDDRLAEVLGSAASRALSFGDMATRQMRGEPLTEVEYDAIHGYAGAIEHPYLLLSLAAAGHEQDLSEPDPMMRIVDIHTWNDPRGPTRYWHAAVGRPRVVTVLLGDRGLLVPAEGALYSYYEVVDTTRVDDQGWRTQVDAAARPDWVNPSRVKP